jgi:serine phosphatase RsbU (regulator of sigma subunit)
LEREVLLATGQQVTELDKQFAAAAQWMSDRLPTITPLLDDYEIAGWTMQADDVGGDFHDWSVLGDGRLALVVGDAHGTGLAASLTAAALRASLAAHAAYERTSGEVLTKLNESLLTRSPGDEQAALAYALLDPNSGKTEFALAGQVAALIVGPQDRSATTTDSPSIGIATHCSYLSEEIKLKPGHVLALVSSGVLQAVDPAGLRIGEASLTALLARHLSDSAKEIVTRFRRLLEHPGQVPQDMTVLILKRRR